MMMSRHRGFTLVELLVVLVLIGLIVASVEFSLARPSGEVSLSIVGQREQARRAAIETGRPIRRVLSNGDTVVFVAALPDGRVLSTEIGAVDGSASGRAK